jgi:hypothetical protein
MFQLEVEAETKTGPELSNWISENLAPLPLDSVVQIRIHGKLSTGCLNAVSAASIRALAPETMNVSVTLPDMRRR